MPRWSLVAVVGLVWLAVVSIGCRREPDPAAELEERLYAPCCWRQSLRDHESPAATALRAEIESRIAAGEGPDAIERDLVARFGEDIRALPAGRDPRWMIGVALAAASVAGLVLLLRLGRRRPHTPSRVTAPVLDEADADRLDDELALVD